jgi:hypothetical protein
MMVDASMPMLAVQPHNLGLQRKLTISFDHVRMLLMVFDGY